MSARILIVDDSLTVRMNLVEALSAAGLSATTCASAGEARQALAAQAPFDLILLDVLLPDADGVDLLHEIREAPHGAGAAVILLSSEAQVRDRIRGLRTGADAYVGKPYEPGYIVAKVRQLLRARRSGPKAVTILVIDDSVTFREQMREALEDAAFDVLVAETGEEGLRVAADARPAALIVDGELPGIDGPSVIRRLRMDAALRHTPCLLLTASSDRGAEVRALESGADAFVRKTEDSAVILARLAAVLRSASETSAAAATDSLLGPKKILAVDDSETFLQKIAGDLRSDGYEVIPARSGEEALEFLAAEPVDCILLDLVMPGIGGQETCRRVKNNPAMRRTPIIMLTALEERSAMIEGLSVGADDFVPKSSDFEVLRARVLAQIRRKQFEDENRLIREQLAQKELEAVEARAAREVGEMQAVLAERKRAEAEMTRLQSELAHVSRWNAMGMMASTLAHELNQPLSAIANYLAAARNTLNRPAASHSVPVTEILAKAGDQVKQAGAIIASLREFIDRREVTRTPQDIGKVITEAMALGLVGYEQLGLKVHTQFAPGLPPVPVNKIQIQQVLVNLFRNAVDAMRATQIRELTIRAAREHGDTVLVSVSDTGPGIPSEIVDRVFEPFTTTKGAGQGMGLGLKICKSIIETHGGTIWITSTSGSGASFHFRIPLETGSGEPE